MERFGTRQNLSLDTMKIQVLQKTQTKEFLELIRLFKVVFDNADPLPELKLLENILQKEDFKVFTIRIPERILGGLTLHILPDYYTGKKMAYIYDVAIHPDSQGCGLGKILISETLKILATWGIETTWVEAESDDENAIAFYSKTPFKNKLNATHFTYFL